MNESPSQVMTGGVPIVVENENGVSSRSSWKPSTVTPLVGRSGRGDHAGRTAIERVVAEELTGPLDPHYGRPADRAGYRHGIKTSQGRRRSGPCR